MAHTPSDRAKLLFVASGLLLVLGTATPGRGQETQADGFRRQYLHVEDYRTGLSSLGKWPSLFRLVRWSHELERAVAEDDQTLSGELLAEFRTRVDSLGAEAVPAFLAARSDSVATTLDSLRAHLERAEAWLEALPPAPELGEGEAANEAQRQRTLVTGKTAVTVPAGVQVGDADSLPMAELSAQEENFLDLVSLALVDLDRLVHLVRTTGRPGLTEATSGPPRAIESTPSTDTGPRPREP